MFELRRPNWTRRVEKVQRRPIHARLRVYEQLRTAHLERAHELEPASIAFFGRYYDFEQSLTEGLDLVPLAGSRELFGLVLRGRVRELELNEPLALAAVKHSLVAIAAARLAGVLRRRRVRVVSYAIENAAPLESAGHRVRSSWRRMVFRFAVRLVLWQTDRLAFGTTAAQHRYEEVGVRARTVTTVVPALPTVCSCVGDLAAEGPRDAEVLFVGAFDERKGLRPLLAAWPLVVAAVPDARLRVIGQGPLEDELRALVADRPEVTWEVAPQRTVIHARQRRAKVLVLWSQPSTTWREQVGLPLVEGLSHGCLVVASEQTGIADWLTDHGHQVVDTGAGIQALAAAVVTSLRSTRSPASVVADLPEVDGRLAADRWLFAP
jgi:glycosyltransferase involved in cell wall biosynthesis